MHEELERELAGFFRKESAVTFSTGFQTNLGIISGLVGRHDFVLNDSENHASIVDGCRLSFARRSLKYEHNDMKALEDALKSLPEDYGKLIITDGVFSMSGDIANLPEIVSLARKYNARVMVDDAHGVGMIGECGRGTANYFGLEDEVDLIMTTFSKSLASLGGCVAASKQVAEYLRHKSRPFIFSASIPPANAAAALVRPAHFKKRAPAAKGPHPHCRLYAPKAARSRRAVCRGQHRYHPHLHLRHGAHLRGHPPAL